MALVSQIEEYLRRRALALKRGPGALEYLLRCGETQANRLDPDCKHRLWDAVAAGAFVALRDVEPVLGMWRCAPSDVREAAERYNSMLEGEEPAPAMVRTPRGVERAGDTMRAYGRWLASHALPSGRSGFALVAVLGTGVAWYWGRRLERSLAGSARLHGSAWLARGYALGAGCLSRGKSGP